MKVLIGNFKGPQGEQGIEGQKGDTGAIGPRGSRWTSGTGITGTSTVGIVFITSGITDAHIQDYYINTNTGNLYECIVPGTADIAEWVYIGNFKGPTGATGPAGSISDINKQKPTYEEASKLENIKSGETVAIAFGKLRKALAIFITHYMQKATTSILGHVKLSNSAAITKAGEYALDAIEKNASVEGTLANLISQQNSDLLNKIEVVYSGLDSAESEINFSPFPFGMYIVISYRFTAIIWRWSNSLRCKIIEKEGSIELTTNKLVLEFNQTVTYICIIHCWHR